MKWRDIWNFFSFCLRVNLKLLKTVNWNWYDKNKNKTIRCHIFYFCLTCSLLCFDCMVCISWLPELLVQRGGTNDFNNKVQHQVWGKRTTSQSKNWDLFLVGHHRWFFTQGFQGIAMLKFQLIHDVWMSFHCINFFIGYDRLNYFMHL